MFDVRREKNVSVHQLSAKLQKNPFSFHFSSNHAVSFAITAFDLYLLPHKQLKILKNYINNSEATFLFKTNVPLQWIISLS